MISNLGLTWYREALQLKTKKFDQGSLRTQTKKSSHKFHEKSYLFPRMLGLNFTELALSPISLFSQERFKKVT